jgi:type I restriction-modification system DNA methylase subunit
MNKDDCCRIFNVEDIIDLPQAAMNIVMGDRERRDAVYRELLSVNRYDMSFDWFRQLYEEEFAQRKKQKQDFTPVEVSEIVAKIALPTVGTIHEPTAGTGGLIISAWWEQCRRAIPWDYYPSQHMISVWELSDRAIPLLLLNLSIRGIMGYVYHGDVLEGTVKAHYILLNRSDDALGFSDVVKAEAGDIIVEQLNERGG